jgi:chaperonin GroEL (HSP60 family)
MGLYRRVQESQSSDDSCEGGSQRVVDEAERSIHDALMVIKDVLERPEIVAGGGCYRSVHRKRIERMVKQSRRKSAAGSSKVCRCT